MTPQPKLNVQPILSQLEIAAQVNRHGQLITHHYTGVVGELVVVPVLIGALPFAADLLRFIKRPLRVEPVRVSTYKGETKHVAPPKLHDDVSFANGRHVLVVEDILDTGTTLAHVVTKLRQAGALSVEVIALLRKQGTQTAFLEEPRWVCFNVPQCFVVGYGLDYQHLHRNMPFIGALVEERGVGKKPEIVQS
jgi:hypoxanthine phosphoribosyltransferase